MIYLAMNHIAFELNQFLRRLSPAGEDVVVLANPVESDGLPDPLTSNKVILFLAGIERDTVPGRSGDSLTLVRSAPIFLNLQLMVAANFTAKSYPESLWYLSRVITFFQQHSVFDHHSSPSLDAGIDKLIVDMEHLDRRELHHIWGMFGGKYMPSALYRVRIIGIDSASVAGRRQIVAEPTMPAHFAKGK